MASASARPLPRPPTVPLPNVSASRWRLILVLVALAVAHVIGWRVTKIDIPTLVTELPRARHIIIGLLQPDAIEPRREVASASAIITMLSPGSTAGGQSGVTRQVSEDHPGGQLVVQPAQVTPGQILNVQGTGWPAGKRGEAFFSQPRGRLRSAGTFTVGEDGTINYAFYVPESSAGNYEVAINVVTPRFGWRPTETFILCLRLMVETLFLALMGTTLAIIFTLPLSFLGARNIAGRSRTGRAIYLATRMLFNLLRSVEVVIIVIIMAVIVGIGSFAGVLAIVVHSIGALGKLYSEAIESIDPGPIEAISATGAHPWQVIRYAVVPQVIPEFLSFTLYRMDINVRMSTIVGLVGGGGIGFILTQYINLLQWNQAATAIWLIAIVVTAIDYLSAWLRQKII